MRITCIQLKGVISPPQEDNDYNDQKILRRQCILHGNKLCVYTESFDYFISNYHFEILSNKCIRKILLKKIKKLFQTGHNEKAIELKHIRVVNIHYNGNIPLNSRETVSTCILPLLNIIIFKFVKYGDETSISPVPISIDRLKCTRTFANITVNYHFGTLKFQPSKCKTRVHCTLITRNNCPEARELIHYLQDFSSKKK